MNRCEVVETLANDVLETTVTYGMERITEDEQSIDEVRGEIITSLLEVLAAYMAQCIKDGADQENGISMAVRNLNEKIEYRLKDSRHWLQ